MERPISITSHVVSRSSADIKTAVLLMTAIADAIVAAGAARAEAGGANEGNALK